MASGEKKSRASAGEKKGDEKPFEELVRRLEEIVDALETGELPLEKSLALFEEGVTLARSGHRRLEDAERRITALMDDGTEKPLDGVAEDGGDEDGDDDDEAEDDS